MVHPERLEMFLHLGRLPPYGVEKGVICQPVFFPLVGWGESLQFCEFVLHAGSLSEDILRISLAGFDLPWVEDVLIGNFAGFIIVFCGSCECLFRGLHLDFLKFPALKLRLSLFLSYASSGWDTRLRHFDRLEPK